MKNLPTKTKILREKYGTFWRYITENRQQRGLLAVTHGFALLWAIYGFQEDYGTVLSLLGLLLPGFNWVALVGSWKGWRSFV